MKAYHISFVFDQPQPGIITIPGANKDEALANFHKQMEQFSNVQVFQVIDLEEIPFLKEIFDRQKDQMSQAVEIEIEDAPVDETNNVIDLKKFN